MSGRKCFIHTGTEQPAGDKSATPVWAFCVSVSDRLESGGLDGKFAVGFVTRPKLSVKGNAPDRDACLKIALAGAATLEADEIIFADVDLAVQDVSELDRMRWDDEDRVYYPR